MDYSRAVHKYEVGTCSNITLSTSKDARTGCHPDGAKASPSSGFVSCVCRKASSAFDAAAASLGIRLMRRERTSDRRTWREAKTRTARQWEGTTSYTKAPRILLQCTRVYPHMTTKSQRKSRHSREVGAFPQQPWGGPHTCRGRAEKAAGAPQQAATTGFHHRQPCCQAPNTPHSAHGSTPVQS